MSAVALGQAIRELDAMAATVPPEAPWTAADALAWDSQTVETWLQTRVPSERVRTWLGRSSGDAGRRGARAVAAAHPVRHPLGGQHGHAARHRRGAQERRFHQGAQAISIGLAEPLGERVVLGAPAELVRHGEAGVVVEAGGRTVTAGRAILAVPPAIAGRIGYRPAMPGWRSQLTQRVPMGSVIKVHAIYEEPFWRQEGLSGFAVSDSGPVAVVYDNCPEAGRPGSWSASSRASRPAPGPAAARPTGGPPSSPAWSASSASGPAGRELLERSWADEEYSGGCYAGYFPPGVWTSYGQALREPVGRLHWAGTETATVWTSYMEGPCSPASAPPTRCWPPVRPAEVVVGQAGQGPGAVAGHPDPGRRVGGEAAAVEHAAEVGGAGRAAARTKSSPRRGPAPAGPGQQGGRLGDPGGEGDGGVVDLDPDPGRLGQVDGVAGQAVGHVDHGRRPRPGQGQAHGQGRPGPAVGGGQAREAVEQLLGRRVLRLEQGQPGRGRPQRAGHGQAVPGRAPDRSTGRSASPSAVTASDRAGPAETSPPTSAAPNARQASPTPA